MKFSLEKSIQNFGRYLLKAYFDLRVIGSVPDSKKPLVLVANHLGLIDGFMLYCSTNRLTRVLTKTEVFNKVTAPILNSGGAIETDWKNADYVAINKARQTLSQGIDVGIFPEGTRCKGNFEWIKDGVILINSTSRVDFVPVFIFGTRFTGKSKNWVPPYKSLIEIVIGSPISSTEIYQHEFDGQNRKDIAIAGERLRQKLALQLAQAQLQVANLLPTDEVD